MYIYFFKVPIYKFKVINILLKTQIKELKESEMCDGIIAKTFLIKLLLSEFDLDRLTIQKIETLLKSMAPLTLDEKKRFSSVVECSNYYYEVIMKNKITELEKNKMLYVVLKDKDNLEVTYKSIRLNEECKIGTSEMYDFWQKLPILKTIIMLIKASYDLEERRQRIA